MNIKEFLIDNYIWIIVIILITIITIIGFLADKKKSSKKNEEVPMQNPNNNVNNQPVNNLGQMQYNEQLTNQMNNNMNLGTNINNLNNQIQQPFNNNVQVPQNLGNFNNQNQMVPEQSMQMNFTTNNNPIPVENLEPTKKVEPIYQPLSEQKPIIAPHPVLTFSTQQNNQSMNILSTENNQNIAPQVPSFTYGQATQQSYMQENQIKEQGNYQIQEPQQQTISNGNFVNTPNFNQSNITIPEPINSTIPVPQPIRPQTIAQNNYGQEYHAQQMNQPIQQNLQQQAPIGFVYGTQQNNQNM